MIGLLTTYCCHLLLHAYRQVSSDKPLSYAELIDQVFRKATNPTLRRLATPARYLVDAALIATQIGYCSVYILFCSRMLKEIVDSYYPDESDRLDIKVYETILVAVLIPYCFVKTLSVLSFFSTLANLVTAACLIVVMQYVFRNLKPLDAVPWAPTSWSTLPLFFGTAMFTFESIALILPIENRMKDRQRFHGWNGLLSTAMAVIIVLYIIVGFFGYLAFGSDAKMVLSNMPHGEWPYQAVKLLYVCCIIVSFNLQLYVPVQILFPPLKKGIPGQWFANYGEYIFRATLVLFTCKSQKL